MSDSPYTDGADTHGNYGGGQWQETINLLRIVQNDYQGARKRLEEVSHALAERELLVSQRLQYALFTSGGYQPLCLTSYGMGAIGSQMGKAVLGQVVPPRTLPGPMRLEVRCLGRFEIRSSWKQLERWQSLKVKSVLEYIMTRPRQPVIKDMLMEALWPDCDPQAANNNLKAAMHGLRQTLNCLFEQSDSFPYVLFLQGSYLMNPDVELWLDVEEFEQHWKLGRSLEKAGKLAEAVKEFELAEALYRGDYLENEPYEDWTLLRREALKDIYIIILGKLADYAVDNGDLESGIVHCQKILTKDSLREDAYRRLMCCYSRLGQRNRALHWYEIYRRTIQAELDTTPDYEMTSLYNQIVKGITI
jgi:DNA-binding SARP family transcriptional activator